MHSGVDSHIRRARGDVTCSDVCIMLCNIQYIWARVQKQMHTLSAQILAASVKRASLFDCSELENVQR